MNNRTDIIWKLNIIAQKIGYSERQLRRLLKKAKIKLAVWKGATFIPEGQLSDLVYRLMRTNKRFNVAKVPGLCYHLPRRQRKKARVVNVRNVPKKGKTKRRKK